MEKAKLTDKKLRKFILSVFELEPGQPLNYREVAGRLAIANEKIRNRLREQMEILAEEGILELEQRGKYVFRGVVTKVEGNISFAPDGRGFVTIDGVEGEAIVEPRHAAESLPGDRVLVELQPAKKGKRLRAKVLSVIERARTEFVGSIFVRSKFAFFEPDNEGINVDFFVPLDKSMNARNGQRVIVKLTEWERGSGQPSGEVVELLGSPGESESEMKSIIVEFGFPLHFPKEVIREAELIDLKIPKEEIKKRKDFRKVTTFTIDPIDAKDFDDAISFKKLKNGNVEIGVHIADVSHYVRPGTALDKEAYQRATSVYLIDRVIPMLPEHLSNQVCSLRPNEEKCCFAAVFEIDKNAQIVSEWFGRTVIKSDRRFTYEEAQAVLETGKGDYADELLELNRLAHILRKEKFENGAISFEKPEIKFRLDSDGKVAEVMLKIRKDAHMLIEDFMLLANKRVAHFIGDYMGGKWKERFVYRIHDAPEQERLRQLKEFVELFGYDLNIKSHKNLAASINALTEAVQGKPEQNVVEQMAIRTMAKAVYSTKNIGHYGLAFTHYSHFTSPIRRYPDVMVHRLLDWIMTDHTQEIPYREQLDKQCRHCSEREQQASKAERASVKFKQLDMLKEFVGQRFVGLISGIKDFGFYVELMDSHAEGLVRLSTIKDDMFRLEANGFQLVGRRRGNTFTMGDKVEVILTKVDTQKRQADFKFVRKVDFLD